MSIERFNLSFLVLLQAQSLSGRQILGVAEREARLQCMRRAYGALLARSSRCVTAQRELGTSTLEPSLLLR